MADKVTLAPVTSFVNDTTAVGQVNSNNAILTTAIDNTLSRDGTVPNQMIAALDMNSNQILNLPAPIGPLSPLRLTDVTLFNVTNPTFSLGGAVQVGYSTTQVAATATVPTGVTQLFTMGYYSVGDGGGAVFVKTGGVPATWTGFTSADGANWVLQAVNRGDEVNSRVFGTKGDGITDDYPSINAAFTFLAANGGGTLRLHAGNFKIRKSIQPPSFCNLKGSGRHVTFITYDLTSPVIAPFNCAILLSGDMPTGISLIHGVNPIYPVSSVTEGQNTVQFTNHADVSHFTVGQFLMLEGPNYGTSFGYPTYWGQITNINSSSGIITLLEPIPLNDTAIIGAQPLGNILENVKVSDLSLLQCADACFQCNFCQHCIVENVDFFITGTGATIEIDSCKDFILQNSYSYNNPVNPYVIPTNPFFYECGDGWNCVFRNIVCNGGSIVFDGGTSESLIENCIVNYPNQVQGTGIFIGSAAQRNKVIGCGLYNIAPTSSGVELQSDGQTTQAQGGNIVMGCVFSGSAGNTGGTGVIISGSSNNSVVGNHFSNLNLGIRVGALAGAIAKGNRIGLNTYQNMGSGGTIVVNYTDGSSVYSIVDGNDSMGPTIIQNTAAPNVANGNYFQCFNSVPTTITSFVGGHDSQIIYIQPGDTNTTVSASAAVLAGGNNWKPVSGNSLLVLRNSLGTFYELYRTPDTLPLANFSSNTWNFVCNPTANAFITTSGQLANSSTTYTNNAAAAAGTITNAPVAGNPTKWIPINDNGTIRNIPAW